MALKVWMLIALVSACSAYTIGHRHTIASERIYELRFSVLCAVSAIGVFLWAFYHVVLWPHFISPLRKLPGPKPDSYINGSAKTLFSNPNGFPTAKWLVEMPNEGLIVYRGLFNSERVVVTSPKGLHEVCSRTYDFVKPAYISRLAMQVLGPGLVLADGAEHKRQRKMLLPAFTNKNVKEVYPLFWSKSHELVESLTDTMTTGKDGVKSTSVDIQDWVSRAALDVITLTALGMDWRSIENPDSNLSKSYHSIVHLGRMAMFLALLKGILPSWLVENLPVGGNDVLRNASESIRATCRDVVQEKKQKLSKGELKDVDLLSVLLRAGEIQDDEAVHQMMTFLTAGHETLATSVVWAVYMLCTRPDWQTKIREEVRANLPSLTAESTITSQDIDQLVQTNAFCEEVLRYWPPIPSTLRETAQDTTLLGQPIPKGIRIVLPIRGANRNPEIWGENAAEFMPERWIKEGPTLDASGGANSKYGQLTFMHGIRNCIGQSFAKGEMACLVATLVGKFNFELQDKSELVERSVEITKGGVTARPVKGMRVIMKPVEGW